MREKRLYFRITKKQHQQLINLAKKNQMDVCEYIRYILFKEIDLNEKRRQLIRILKKMDEKELKEWNNQTSVWN
jgi:hypothetical protein